MNGTSPMSTLSGLRFDDENDALRRRIAELEARVAELQATVIRLTRG